MSALLSVNSLSVRYASVQALFDVSIDVPEGSVVAVLGANGAGKSTLARTVSGLVPPFRGTVTFGGATSPSGIHTRFAARDSSTSPKVGDLSRPVGAGEPADGGPQGWKH
jgi:ABC-type branched-subunit amino acid transport system ATPase component